MNLNDFAANSGSYSNSGSTGSKPVETSNSMLSSLRNSSMPLRQSSFSTNNLLGVASNQGGSYYNGNNVSPRHSMLQMQSEGGGRNSPAKIGHSDSYHSFFEDQSFQQNSTPFFDTNGRSTGGRNANPFNAGMSRSMDAFDPFASHMGQGNVNYPPSYGSPTQRTHY